MFWLIAFFALYYTLIGVVMLISILRLRRAYPVENEKLPFVSVMVAARNEEEHVHACLESLLHQSYPQHLYEVIIINDRSTDRTAEIITSFSKCYPNLIDIHIDQESLPGLTGKQRALTAAYDRCRGEIILNTDADCVVPQSWIRQIVSQFHPDTGLVIGISVCHAPNDQVSFFTKLQSLDLLHLLAYAAGAAGWHRTTSCIGNNMAYRRQAVDEIGGLIALPDSVTEDAVLAQAIEHQTDWNVDAALHPDAVIVTQSARNLREFYRQRKRWLVGGLRTRRVEILLLQGLFVFHLLLAALPLLGLLWSQTWWLSGALALLVKLAVDSAVCYTMCRCLERMDLFKWMLPYELFLLIYSVIIGLGALLTRQIIWKGQRFTARR